MVKISDRSQNTAGDNKQMADNFEEKIRMNKKRYVANATIGST